MTEDTDFLDKCKTCKNIKELYLAYKEFGYTDLDYSDFEPQFNQLFNDFPLTEKENHELTTEDLEKVVGGFGDFNPFGTVKGLIPIFPVIGPIVKGTTRIIKATTGGSGILSRKETDIDSVINKPLGTLGEKGIF